MDTQQVSAPSRAPSPLPGDATPSSGVVHINSRHTRRFTVVGNHLAQHRELSLLAIGLATHIQSLPTGAKIGIRFLADRFPESEARIAAALRELEVHGYLRRIRERLPNGRVVTRTCSYNQPDTTPHPSPASRPQPRPRPRPRCPVPAPAQCATPTPLSPDRTLAPPPALPAAPAPSPPLPTPHAPSVELLCTATDLLADLRRDTPQLILSERDVDRLSHAVAAWLERGATPEMIRRALAADLPMPLKHPAKLLEHRLAALLPPPLPLTSVHRVVTPFQTCDGCERAFRSPTPGHCRDCRTDEHHPPTA
ncbi:helix-turn-helix domain-containing protein [Streptomyces sp. NBC_00842]|uniref:helix-turn-helix domain-containing protein n=1 Tax=Streptomyces sp. NBC_00842 TaxID=2975848 RepID=UPI00386B7D92|nr:helix-turn-helix domain-containing protein [Streptomyces sp. NBC_00842]